jgi:hypothetical protein
MVSSSCSSEVAHLELAEIKVPCLVMASCSPVSFHWPVAVACVTKEQSNVTVREVHHQLGKPWCP